MVGLADLLNAPSELEHEGKVYKLRKATLLEQAQFQRWMEAEARASAAAATDLPEGDRQFMMRETQRDIASKVYAWGGVQSIQCLATPTGFGKFLSIILADQGVTHELGTEIVTARWDEVVRLVTEVNDDPDPQKKTEALRSLQKLVPVPSLLNKLLSACATTPSATPPPSSPSAT